MILSPDRTTTLTTAPRRTVATLTAVWALRALAASLAAVSVFGRRIRQLGGEGGEGVISTAIAVLIMAFLGALMWVGFRALWQTAADNTARQVNTIGR